MAKTSGNNEDRACLNAAGVYIAMMLAEKHELPTGKVIELLNDFINTSGARINNAS